MIPIHFEQSLNYVNATNWTVHVYCLCMNIMSHNYLTSIFSLFYSLIADESENQVRDMAILQEGKFTKCYNADKMYYYSKM